MADTGIGVSWHLEYACPFRRGAAVTEFGAAYAATGRLRVIEACVAGNDVYGDLAVHGTLYAGGTKSPLYGVRIGEAVGAVGSLEAARGVCATCPANGRRAGSGAAGGGGMAGCCGWIEFEPDDAEVDATLRAAIDGRGLRRQFEAAFEQTDPVGYGFWIDSPLDGERMALLAAVWPAVGGSGRASEDAAVFRRACALGAKHGIRMHVRMSPPGHTDFGNATTFPHCPRCKRGIGERWKKHYSTRPRACAACGHRYVPAATAASEPMEDHDANPDRLEGMLSAGAFAALRDEWLRRHEEEPKDWLERLITGEAGAGELMGERGTGGWWRRVMRWFGG